MKRKTHIKKIISLSMALLVSCHIACSDDRVINLSGSWQVKLDPQDIGTKDSWQKSEFTDSIILPGSLPERGYGDEPSMQSPWTGSVKWKEWEKPQYAPYKTGDNFKMPFWLQPKKIYVGAAWYQKEVKVPRDWNDKRIVLHLERPHWETRVWVDNKEVSTRNSLSTPHEHDLTAALSSSKNRISVRVDNRMIIPVGDNSHSVSDHTQSNWNGLVGKLELRATEKVWVDDLQVYPDITRRQAVVKVTIGNVTGGEVSGKVSLTAANPQKDQTDRIDRSYQTDLPETTIEITLPLGDDILLWDEFNPNLYTTTASLINGESKTVKFGLRKLETEGTQFVINGRKTFMRGTLECAIFPLTGYPPTDPDYWRKIIRTCQAHGLNHIRFHSWCPPEAAFIAADELGFYYQVECASWANGKNSGLGKGLPVDKWLYEEGKAITKAYGNHPSFILMAYGNEPGSKHEAYLAKWCNYWKQHAPRQLHTGGSGWPLIKESDFHSTPKPRIQGWGEGLRSIINSKPPCTDYDWRNFVNMHSDKPTVSHEIGQWCVYPNFKEIKKYKGVLMAKNFELFREFLKDKQMKDQAEDFLMASGKLQTLCYKADIEAALRTPGFGGFQLLDLHDFPGQGTALVGVLDPFWESKPYVTPTEYSRFCNETVPLARLVKRTFTADEPLSFALDIAHYGAFDLKQADVQWTLRDSNGETVDSGHWEKRDIPNGGLCSMGSKNIDLTRFQKAVRLQLEVGIEESDFKNSWNVWVYPNSSESKATSDIMITSSLNRVAMEQLKAGGKVLLTAKPSQVKTSVQLGFSSIFWNTAWTGGQAPHTLGILCNPKHPALAQFPTEYHSDWQWWHLVTEAATMEMDALPAELRPIVQVVPDWFDPKRLGLLFEAKLNGGKLMVCSIDIEKDIDNRPVAKQFRQSILSYINSKQFQPKTTLSTDQIKALFKDEPPD